MYEKERGRKKERAVWMRARERERKREKDIKSCVYKRERERVVCMREKEQKGQSYRCVRECVCLSVCLFMRVCARERERLPSVCVCLCV